MKQLISSYKNILDTLYDGVYVVDKNRKIHYWNQAAEKITGYSEEKIVGAHCHNNILEHVDETGENLCTTNCPLVKAMESDQAVEEEIYLHHNDGHRVPVKVKITPMHDETGEVIGAIEVFSNNSEYVSLLHKYKELEAQFFIDDLTKVGNKDYIKKRLNDSLEELKKYDWPFGVVKFSIRDFKSIKKNYGKKIGDQVLRMVANTLKGDLEAYEVLGRINEQEFVVILAGVYEGDLEIIEEKLKRLVEVSYLKIGNNNISVAVSTQHYLLTDKDETEQIFTTLNCNTN